jgi:hypothetical protein
MTPAAAAAAGTGEPVKHGDTVSVRFEGKRTCDAEGKVFGSNMQPDAPPLSFPVGSNRVVPGFDRAMIGMKVRKRHFSSTLYIKINILPRQARDKQRENSKKCRFLAGGRDEGKKATRLFCDAILYTKNSSFYQDRLGTNIGRTQKETRFLTGGACKSALSPLAF